MPQFKPGDKVLCIDAGINRLTTGKEYEVLEHLYPNAWVKVKANDSGVAANYHPHRFQLVVEPDPEVTALDLLITEAEADLQAAKSRRLRHYQKWDAAVVDENKAQKRLFKLTDLRDDLASHNLKGVSA